MDLNCCLIGHLGGTSGEDESGQTGQVSGLVQVVRQQSVTHDDVAPQHVGESFSVFHNSSYLKKTNIVII